LAHDRREAVDFVVNQIQIVLSAVVLIKLSRIVFLPPNDPMILAINTSVTIEHGRKELRDQMFNGVAIDRAYIYTSKTRLLIAAK
jgi:hypothetical protein